MSAEALALYHEKNAHLGKFYEAVEPMDFYRGIFPVGSFERAGHHEDAKPNGILLDLSGEKPQHRLVTDELDGIRDTFGREFVVMSPLAYSGRSRKGRNTRLMYALTFDLDGVGMSQLWDVLHQMKNTIIPMATYIVNSGNGLHLYYVFKNPIELKQPMRDALRVLKYDLTRYCIWNKYTSTIRGPQVQSIFQGFRMVGTQSKLGPECPVVAFEVGDKIDLEHLNQFVYEESRVNEANLKSALTLEEAKENYPDWYQKRIVEGKPRGHWVNKRALYEWWLRRLTYEVGEGHRYYGVMCLAAYGKKCGIPKEKLREDAYTLLERLDTLSTSEDNRFTAEDIEAALKMYTNDAYTFPRDEIGKLAGVPMPVNKRNGRKQKQHVQRMTLLRDNDYPNGVWRNEKGRPMGSGTKARTVIEYRKAHPEARKADCIRDTGLSKPTVYKWWDGKKRDARQPEKAPPLEETTMPELEDARQLIATSGRTEIYFNGAGEHISLEGGGHVETLGAGYGIPKSPEEAKLIIKRLYDKITYEVNLL